MRTPHRGLLAIALAGALATGTGLLNTSAANAAIPGPSGALEAENIVASGSDTTIGVMTALDGLFNNLPGCVTVGATTPSSLNGACAPGDTTNATSPNRYHDSVSEKFPTNSGIGRAQLCGQGTLDVPKVNFSRASSPQGNECPGLTGVAYAQDAVTPFVFDDVVTANSDGTYTATTTATPGSALPIDSGSGQPIILADGVKAIYGAKQDSKGEACKTAPATATPDQCGTNVPTDYYTWNDLGVPATSTFATAHVIPYSAPSGSGTLNTFNSKFLAAGASALTNIPASLGVGTATPHIIEENNALPIAKNGDSANALFFYSYGRYTAKSNATPKPADAAAGSITAVQTSTGAVVPTTEATITAVTAVGYRKIYNIYRFATPGTLGYVGESGYICLTGRAASGTTETAANNPVNAAIRANGFIPFPLAATGDGVGDANGMSYCRVTSTDKSALPTDNVGATPMGIPAGSTVARIDFSRPVLGLTTTDVGVKDASGNVLAATLSCLDLSGAVVSCPTLAYQDPAQTVLITVTAPLAVGATYTTFANVAGITDQYAKPLGAAASVNFPSPTPAPTVVTQTVTVAGPTTTTTVTVPGPVTTNTVTKTVTITTTLPVLVIGQITVSGTALKLPVTCVSATGCKGKILLKVNGKTVTKTYSLGKSAITTLSFTNTRPKGAKAGKTSLTFQLIPTSGQTSLGKRSGTVKF